MSLPSFNRKKYLQGEGEEGTGYKKIHCEEPCGRDRRASKSEYKQPVFSRAFLK
jgi:hypothetical protein